ncbi:MAG: helix-hairpin-helix domain-containing protein [Thermomicrobiales bacterium]
MRALKVFIPAALIAAAICVLLLLWWDSSREVTITVTGNPDATITVYMDGAVVRPGAVSLPAGARLDEAIAAAGGLSEDADVTRRFLAARVGDNERIVIPRRAATTPGGTPGDEAPAVGKLNLNTATTSQLQELPGVGAVLAQRIVTYRDEHGPFTSVDDLENVEGIGPSLLEKLRPYVTVGE